ncbi:hypothetical protein BGZ51_006098 [Haplosporangium sp. Z 767]|nr:hypothetical protein BGZ51_006098 [Haplosporangium sp. Z 767]KAF9186242.1 hypothetical protein BGZ50_002571 [Haplosporangium sp. Z 11]
MVPSCNDYESSVDHTSIPYTPRSSTSTATTSSLSPPQPMMRPTSHSFSLQRPLLAQDAKKSRNAKRLSLLVPPSPGKLETIAAMASASSPSFPPPTSSFSNRRHFTSAPLSALLPPSQIQSTPNTQDTTAKRQSQLMLDQALPTPRLPMSTQSTSHRSISAYFSDFSVECGVASPYTSEPVCILPHLFLGAEHNAMDVNMLSRLGISAVLNVAVEIATASQQQQQGQKQDVAFGRMSSVTGDRIVETLNGHLIRYKNLSWTHYQKNLQSEFPEAFEFIEEAKNLGGKVLVHCQLGVSRSASLVIAYVMKTQQMKLTDAYDFVKARSGVISPNMSLMYQLSEFEKSLRKSGSNRQDFMSFGSGEDEEDGYPYPTEKMEIDNDKLSSSVSSSNTVKPVASSSKRSNLVLASTSNSTTSRSPLATRPRSTRVRSSFSPMAMPPQTPMTDRFSFDSPVTSAKPSTSRSQEGRFPESEMGYPSLSVIPSTPLMDVDMSMNLPATPTKLSPPIPAFAAASRHHDNASMTSSSYASSFADSIHSRPSSTSSASSASLSHSALEEKEEDEEETTVMASSKDEIESGSQQPTNKKAMIHTLATALTRKFSGRFQHRTHSRPQQQSRQSSVETTSRSDSSSVEGAKKKVATGKKDSEFIFSPRPCSPPLHDPHNRTFEEFYQALRPVEG